MDTVHSNRVLTRKGDHSDGHQAVERPSPNDRVLGDIGFRSRPLRGGWSPGRSPRYDRLHGPGGATSDSVLLLGRLLESGVLDVQDAIWEGKRIIYTLMSALLLNAILAAIPRNKRGD